MECPLSIPGIVERLFNFLYPHDLYKCQFVCKSWYDEARKRLTKCPTIDSYSMVATLRSDPSEPSEEKADFLTRVKRLFVKEKKSLGDIFNKFIIFSRGETNFRPENLTDMEKAVKSFFEEDMQCIPSFSFGRFSPPFEALMDSVDFKYPTVRIESSQCHFFSKYDQNVPITRQLDLPADETWSTYGSVIQAFHINRYGADLKVIVTDWYDSKSNKPNLSDPNYPIKSLTYFIKKRNGKLEKAIEKYVKGSDVIISGAKFENHDQISFNTSGDPKFKFSPAISIAFAGKQVKTAVFDHTLSKDSIRSTFLSAIENFKQNLDFPLDDGKVLGFMFCINFRHEDLSVLFKTVIWDQLVENLPKVELMGFDVYTGEFDPQKIIIHLIKI
ncbi:uncharacterized protein LOC141852760 [Brevipalpus obovatus]|uniref:uncharacterized protein LOC141852760 n=1 Tax=Brevipalpus obovatus TaxID=246614 RepID=UPI003D9E4725